MTVSESKVHRPETTMRKTGHLLFYSDFVKQQPGASLIICKSKGISGRLKYTVRFSVAIDDTEINISVSSMATENH
jgi:hypothetical protein